MHPDVTHPEPSWGPAFPARTHNWAGEQRAIVGHKTNSPRDSLQRFFAVGAGHIPLSCTDAWKRGARISMATGCILLTRAVCHSPDMSVTPQRSESQGQQCVMDRDWSGTVLGSGILAERTHCKHVWGEALQSYGDTAQFPSRAQRLVTIGSR